MCPEIGDLFPDAFKEIHATAKVTAQSIIILRIPSFKADYDKFIILLTTSIDGEQMAAVCINTKPSPKSNHIIIKQSEYDFLKYDSHIDCSVIIPFDKNWLKDLLKKEPYRYIGEISAAQYIDIVLKLRNSPSISDAQREKFKL
ncbi:MAG: hypothetical protein MUP99_02375 [Pedobacter sp.]|nr:hypothetical protein [Pedobacter sp.]